MSIFNRDSQDSLNWHTIIETVKGFSHQRSGLPNQDAILDNSVPQGIILAVSDGHGSAKCFRSHNGSNFAVTTAIQAMNNLFKHNESNAKNENELNLTYIKNEAEERLPKIIVRKWREKVEHYQLKNPFTSEELSTLEQKEGAKVRERFENPDDPNKYFFTAYGATLLTVAVCRKYILYLQLGDGDILAVYENGEVIRPLPPDDRLFANETTSLCSTDPWKDFRVVFQPIVDPNKLPVLILAATDGYSNSFKDDEAFFKVGTEFMEIIRSEGQTYVKENLTAWLEETTKVASGDDISLGLLINANALDLMRNNQNAAISEKNRWFGISIPKLKKF